MEHLYPYPKMGTSFLEILHDPLTRKLLGFDAVHAEPTPFIAGVTSRLKFLLSDVTQQLSFLKIGYTALEAFLQANCTGPPLDFDTEAVIIPESYRDGDAKTPRDEIFEYLSVDGSRPYPLTPHIELFWLAKVVLSNPTLAEAGFNGRRARSRVNFWHQRLLSEESPTLRDTMHADAEILEQQMSSRVAFGGAAAEEHFVEFLIERAVVRTYYGDDASARTDLARAATTRQFQFVLTGALGKRTKFQEKETSQLVVLAKSRDAEPEPYSSRKNSRVEGTETPPGKESDLGLSSLQGRSFTSARASDHQEPTSPLANPPTQPSNLRLNDDTLLERINFTPTSQPATVSSQSMTQVVPSSSELPPQLSSLDPSNQPVLYPMDSIILLATASSITNTSPDDGLVREETLPYATRVLDGGSSNWSVYTQALLVRSRIEGYKARTTERGLLQLQALVDQVIAETSQSEPPSSTNTSSSHLKGDQTSNAAKSTSEPTGANTFLPRPQATESASVAERLQYAYQISPPLRWELEAELAQRWTSLGGLKTALDIYERLQMHAEVALCLAATDQEGKAVELLKSLLFDDVSATEEAGEETLKSPTPDDAPRLLCILGDITNTPSYYTLSWTASNNRYARAQRSLARQYTKVRDFKRAEEAYRLALQISRLDRASWFSLGCVQLELEDWMGAVETFTRCVQLDDGDAESWSNLAVALLRLPPRSAPTGIDGQASSSLPPTTVESESEIQVPNTDIDIDSSTPTSSTTSSLLKHTYDALRALRRAATLKRDDPRIWDNYLTVVASIPPSAPGGGTPWNEVIQAMGRVIELRGKKEGEGCIDLPILGVLTEFVTSTWRYPAEDEDGIEEREEQDDTVVETNKDEKESSSTTSLNAENFDKETNGAHHHEKGTTTSTTTSIPTSIDHPQAPIPQPASEPKLPHIPRSFLNLIDTLITPLNTTSPILSTILSKISQWRHRPHAALLSSEKSWRLLLAQISSAENFEDVSTSQWSQVVEKTIWLMERYRDLGGLQRERTGGEVEAKWRFKSKSAARKVLGRGKSWEERDEGRENWMRLKTKMDEL